MAAEPVLLGLTPALESQLRGLTLAVRSISHGPTSDSEDGGPLMPLGLEALTMALAAYTEAATMAADDGRTALAVDGLAESVDGLARSVGDAGAAIADAIRYHADRVHSGQ